MRSSTMGGGSTGRRSADAARPDQHTGAACMDDEKECLHLAPCPQARARTGC